MPDIPNRDWNEVWEGIYLSMLECWENVFRIRLICRGPNSPHCWSQWLVKCALQSISKAFETHKIHLLQCINDTHMARRHKDGDILFIKNNTWKFMTNWKPSWNLWVILQETQHPYVYRGLRTVHSPYSFVSHTFLWYLCLLSLVQEDSPLSHFQNPLKFALQPLAPRL